MHIMQKANIFWGLIFLPLLLSGCGGGNGLEPPNSSGVVVVQGTTTHNLTPYVPSPQEYRWYDIADNLFSSEFRNQFVYRGGQGQVSYQASAETLRGTLEVSGLKPNFAYQIKLEGQPTARYPWTPADLLDPRNWTNKQLGSLGRWWCVDCGWNVADKDLRQHKGHLILGYLLFDFFVTDHTGTASYSFVLNSSFHVLWKTSQRPPTANDGAVRNYNIIWSSYGYGGTEEPSGFNHGPIGIYAEWEPTRPLPGQVVLPEGNYQCRLLLTEESFHNKLGWDAPDPSLGGFWAHALSDEELSFQVKSASPPTPGAITGTVKDAVTGRKLRGATVLVLDTGQSTMTSSNGTYTITNVPAGSHEIKAWAPGYLEASKIVFVPEKQTVTVNFELQPSK